MRFFIHLRQRLVTKLALLVTLTVVLALVALVVCFDLFLRDSFSQSTRARMQHAYQRLSYNLNHLEQDLTKGAALAANTESLVASAELINRYQNKTDYNTFLIDEEKKALTLELLQRVKISLHSDMVLYGQDKELIAFVSRQGTDYQLGYLTFVEGQPLLLQRTESEREFQPSTLPAAGNIQRIHISYYPSEDIGIGSLTTYVRAGQQLVVKSHHNMIDSVSGQHIGHLEFSHRLDYDYFTQFSKDIDIELKLSFNSAFAAQAPTLNSRADIETLSVSHTPEQYLGVMKKDTISGPVYFTVALDKTLENTLINSQRRQFLWLLLALATGILLFMRFVFQRSLARPLDRLMEQIRHIKQGNYTTAPTLASGDELEEISHSVNLLAAAVAQREQALEQSQHDEAHRANHDVLTGLPNRRFLAQRLAQALSLAQSQQGELALIFLDVDQFKLVNDTLGHAVGDQLLVQIGQRLQDNLRACDSLARIGGDEFTVLIDRVTSAAEVAQIVQNQLALFQQPFACDGHDIHTSASIGIARYPQDGQDSTSLLKAADLALYQAKDKGRNTYCFFSTNLAQQVGDRAQMTQALKCAIEAGDQFVLHYQPKISTVTAQVMAAEALIRWNRPNFGLVSPLNFIPLAEENRQIIALGDWIVGQACHDLAQLNAQGLVLQHLGINVSNVQLSGHNLLDVLRQTMAENALQASQIELEITESFIAHDAGQAITSLEDLRALGLQLAIDDFGTGYSSLSYLKQVPFTRLKIDKSFVDGLPHDANSVAVVRAIIGLAKNFGLLITAEGVENAAQLAFLQQAGCHDIQGYYYARPMPLPDFIAFCQQRGVIEN